MRTRAYLGVLLVFAAALLRAQSIQRSSNPSGFGSVAGHVSCADTNAPARFARVTIESVDDLKESPKGVAHSASSVAVDTKLDGSFLIRSVEPGKYYMLAEMPGYLSPLAALAPDAVELPSAEDKEKLRAMLQQVTVVRGQESRLDFRLERGASLSGTVRYDDGSPAAGVSVSPLRKAKDGTLQQVSNGLQDRFSGPQRTDDLGHFRVAALLPAEYLVSVDLPSFSVSMSGGSLLGAGGYSRIGPGRHVQIYSGGTARRSEAKPILVGEGQDIDGADITIPISKLHSVSGIVIAKQDGHPLSSGSVVLQDPSDKSTITETWVRLEDGRFEMDFVPEGNYLLRVSSAADGVVEHGTSDNNPNVTFTRFKSLQSYLDAEQPLNVSGDLSGIVVNMLVKIDSGDTKPKTYVHTPIDTGGRVERSVPALVPAAPAHQLQYGEEDVDGVEIDRERKRYRR
jgi:hypothetical protein